VVDDKEEELEDVHTTLVILLEKGKFQIRTSFRNKNWFDLGFGRTEEVVIFWHLYAKSSRNYLSAEICYAISINNTVLLRN